MGEDSADAFKRLSTYRDRAIFVGHWAGTSEWERHTVGDEIVMVVDGSTTIFFLDGETEHPATLRAGEFVVVPRGTWHRFETPKRSRFSASHHNRPITPPTVPPDKREPVRGRSGDLPAEHHGVVLVGQVVAMGHVRPDEVAEPAVDDHRFARIERNDVLFALTIGVGRSSDRLRLAVAHDDAVFLLVHVHRVHPATAAVAELPDAEAVDFCCANGVLPAGFFKLRATVAGSKAWPLINHSTSPPPLPRCSSNTNRLFSSSFKFDGTGGTSRMYWESRSGPADPSGGRRR